MSENSPHQLSRELLRVDAEAEFALVASRFNAHIVDPMLERAQAALREHGVDERRIFVHRVPGVYELPVACRWALDAPKVSAVIGLGAVVRGDTPHFDYVAGEGARGLMDVMLQTGKPVVFGVLTTNDEAQALERADPNRGDKGYEAGLAALEMVALGARISRQHG